MPYNINGHQANIQEPREMGGPVFVPLRSLIEAAGGQASWDGGSNTAGGTLNGVHARVPVGTTDYTIDGEARSMSVATFMDNGEVWVPLEFFEAFGTPAFYDGNTKTVTMNTDSAQAAA